jgi:hypothetical protein
VLADRGLCRMFLVRGEYDVVRDPGSANPIYNDSWHTCGIGLGSPKKGKDVLRTDALPEPQSRVCMRDQEAVV